MEPSQVRVMRPAAEFETGCALGTDFSFLVRKGASSKVVVEFQGGGDACWDYDTCNAQRSDFVEVNMTDSGNEVLAITFN